MPEDELERSEVEALLETRRELGLRYDRELVDGFADRIERAVEQRYAVERDNIAWERHQQESAGKRQLALGIVSLVAGIPISAITLEAPDAGDTSVVSLIVAWGGIAAVNIAHAFQSRRRRR
jgi:hypothetical protein